jgi:uncharacterized protein YbcI
MARPTTKPPQGEQLAEISNMVVSVYADYLGRGPTKARTYASDGVVTCLLEDTLTRAEQSLISSGRSSAVLEVRNNLQETMREELVKAMERLTEQRVRAMISGTQLEPDITSEVFVLDESRGEGIRAPEQEAA